MEPKGKERIVGARRVEDTMRVQPAESTSRTRLTETGGIGSVLVLCIWPVVVQLAVLVGLPKVGVGDSNSFA